MQPDGYGGAFLEGRGEIDPIIDAQTLAGHHDAAQALEARVHSANTAFYEAHPETRALVEDAERSGSTQSALRVRWATEEADRAAGIVYQDTLRINPDEVALAMNAFAGGRGRSHRRLSRRLSHL